VSDESNNAGTALPQQTTLTDEHVQMACGAALEVLNGADQSRILQLLDPLRTAKMVLAALAQGQVVVRVKPPAPNRAERRATSAQKRRGKTK
jgi:hypothetical protein